MASLNIIDKEINQQNIEFNRFKKILENLMDTTSRECQAMFDKITKEFENNQLSISKYIDFKIEAFVLKSTFDINSRQGRMAGARHAQFWPIQIRT